MYALTFYGETVVYEYVLHIGRMEDALISFCELNELVYLFSETNLRFL